MVGVTHAGAGGCVQVMPAHGSLAQAPFTQSFAQLLTVVGYEHTPPLHVPVEENTRSVWGSRQNDAGGVLQVTPEQGSPRHAPAWQPLAHELSTAAYVQVPAEQVPDDE